MEFKKSLAEKVIDKMYKNDGFSSWLGIECVKIETGACVLKMKIRKEMLNGFGIAHGGITYSLADSALAFASNSHGRKSVSVETSISHTEPCKEGDVLIATAEEMSLSNKIGIYQITIKNQDKKIVALFKGTVYRTSKDWDVTNSESLRINEMKKEIIQNKKIIFPELSYKIVGAAFDVYNEIGGNHKELVYQKALFESFKKNNIKTEQQVFNSIKFENKIIGKNYFDFLVDSKIVVEIKSTDRFSKSHYDQLLNYLIISKLKLGILISFGRNEVKFKRVLNIELLNKEKIKTI
ncbi:MAG: GxxExxY protein [Bacteroidia bacterium]